MLHPRGKKKGRLHLSSARRIIDVRKEVAVRWLGAYGYIDAENPDGSLEWEMNPRRDVSCEIISQLEKQSNVPGAGVGLLVDVEGTSLVQAFAGDAWTRHCMETGGDAILIPARNFAHVTTWAESFLLARKIQKFQVDEGGFYIEGVIRRPVYKAVLLYGRGGYRGGWKVHGGINSTQRRLAEMASRFFDVPLLEVRHLDGGMIKKISA